MQLLWGWRRIEKCLIPDNSFLHEELAVADIIYNPWKTKLIFFDAVQCGQAFDGFQWLQFARSRFSIAVATPWPIRLYQSIVVEATRQSSRVWLLLVMNNSSSGLHSH